MENLDKILQGISGLINALVANFGAWGTVGVAVLVYLAFFFWRHYTDKRKDKEAESVLADKEKTVQRLANEVRMWRIVYFKEVHKWTDDQVEKLFISAEFKDPIEARAFLEKNRTGSEKEKKS